VIVCVFRARGLTVGGGFVLERRGQKKEEGQPVVSDCVVVRCGVDAAALKFPKRAKREVVFFYFLHAFASSPVARRLLRPPLSFPNFPALKPASRSLCDRVVSPFPGFRSRLAAFNVGANSSDERRATSDERGANGDRRTRRRPLFARSFARRLLHLSPARERKRGTERKEPANAQNNTLK
jgi:hypothetical protein